MVGNLPACVGDTGPIPRPRRFHSLGAVKPVGLKPMCLERVLHNKRSHSDKRPCTQKRAAPTSCKWRKPVQSDIDPAETLIS